MKHDASTYVHARCRCSVCTAANTARVREYRKRQTAESTSEARGTNHLENQIDPATAATARGHGNQEVRS